MKRYGLIALCGLPALLAPAGVPSFGEPVEVGLVGAPPLKEASGVAASRIQPDVLFTHNDSAADPTVYAIDSQGRHLATFKLPDFPSGDFEDVAVGPGPDPRLSYVYLGDIGDNQISRTEIVVYRFPEPWVDPAWSADPVSAELGGGQAFRLQYPEVAVDAETLLVDPLRRELFVLTKQSGVARVFKISIDQLSAEDLNVLEWVQDVPFHQASGGSMSADGTQILLRNEDYAEWRSRTVDQSVEEALAGEGFRVPVVGRPVEPNGEAIGFSSDGNSYFTLSDDSDPPTLYSIARALPPYHLGWESMVLGASQWRYLDTGVDLGEAWRRSDYSDLSWKVGSGAFGYGDDRLQTQVLYGGVSKKRHVTTYFRSQFMIGSSDVYAAAELRILVDDGCAVFLNGVEVARLNLAESAAYDTLALQEQKELEGCWFRLDLDPTHLKPGANTLAVEVHQHTQDSKDLRFDLQLVARKDPQSRVLGLDADSAGKRLRLSIPTLEPVMVQSSEDLNSWEDWARVEPFEVLNSVIDLRPGRTRFYRLVPVAQ